MTRIPRSGQLPGWESDDVVHTCFIMAVDRFGSMARRPRMDAHHPQPEVLDHLVAYAGDFLTHNAIIASVVNDHQCNRPDSDNRIIVKIENFVGDSALITLEAGDQYVENHEVAKSTLQLAESIIQECTSVGISTSIGIAYGHMIRFNLHGEFHVVVGEEVDRAIRLSWVARENQILTTNNAKLHVNVADTGDWSFHPTEGWHILLDKWSSSNPFPKSLLPGSDLYFSYTNRGNAEGFEARRPVNPRLLAVVEKVRRDLMRVDDEILDKCTTTSELYATYGRSPSNLEYGEVQATIDECKGLVEGAIETLTTLEEFLELRPLGEAFERDVEAVRKARLQCQEILDGLPIDDVNQLCWDMIPNIRQRVAKSCSNFGESLNTVNLLLHKYELRFFRILGSDGDQEQ